jgi:ubiquinone/menaquinone biosynthesis C-methylase UbiE
MKPQKYTKRAKEYSKIGISGTPYLVYRDLLDLLKKHVVGKRTLDFGCGTGRSTKFLKELGYEVFGVDISKDMLEEARIVDPEGNYQLINGDEIPFKDSTFDCVFSSIVFLEFSSPEIMVSILQEMKRVLKDTGVIVIATTSEEFFQNEWLTTLTDFPENKILTSGSVVKSKVRDTGIEFNDYYWQDRDYREAFAEVGLKVCEVHKPLGRKDEPYDWINEQKIPPWIIYVVKNNC